jgi:hypothetical protein
MALDVRLFVHWPHSSYAISDEQGARRKVLDNQQ